jgi:nucleotide-binding universal stress UspA family protein
VYENILVPTDGSKRARNAVENAIRMAERYGSTIHALYVMDMGDAAFVATPSDIAETRARLEKKGKKYTERVRELAELKDVECVVETRTGVAEDEIVAYAAENDIDLIVMGKRGRSDPDKPAFGTITDRVIGSTDVLVLAV